MNASNNLETRNKINFPSLKAKANNKEFTVNFFFPCELVKYSNYEAFVEMTILESLTWGL